MSLTKQQALEMFRSDDLTGIGMEADALRRKMHPEGVVTYIIDRNINYTNFCTEYCTFCAFYRPLKGKLAAEGYILDFETIYEKIRETVGCTGCMPSTFEPKSTAVGGAKWDEATPVGYLKTLAISRLYLSNFKNVQASWVTQGLKVL